MTLFIGVATWLAGWWAVPIVALVAGFAGAGAVPTGVAATSAWALLLVADAFLGKIGRVADALSGIMGLPTPALIVITLVFPALLAWSAASIGDAARSLRATSRLPS